MATGDSGNYAGALLEVIEAEAILKFSEASVSVPLVRQKSEPKADQITFIAYNAGSNQVTSADVTNTAEGTVTPSTALDSEKKTITLDMQSVMLPIYDEAKLSNADDVYDHAGALAGNAMASKLDSIVNALYDGFSGAVGANNSALTVDNLFDALAKLKQNSAPLMGPVLAGLGISIFAANMFIFYFAVASAITPPVALAAFAASSITKAEPMATGFAAVKVGIVMFVIPFVFAIYPEILLIEAAVIDPTTSDGAEIEYLKGYTGQVDWTALCFLLMRLLLGLYLLASALARFDRNALPFWDVALRLSLAVLIMVKDPTIYLIAMFAACVWLGLHFLRNRNVYANAPT